MMRTLENAKRKRSILLGEWREDLQFDVRAQHTTATASVEIHDIHHVTPRTVDTCKDHAFMDLALNHRPDGSLVRFPEVRGHRTRPFGDMFFLPAHLRWHGSWGGGGPQRSICVAFSEDGNEGDRDWTAEQIDLVLDLRGGSLRETMIRIASELQNPGFASTLMLDALCTELAILLRRHLDRTHGGPVRGRLGNHQLRSIEDMIDRDGPAPTLAEFAARCGLSVRHFSRLFRLSTGQSITAFAIARRVNRAKELLGNTIMPIKQVAWECGFQTAAAFSVAFRRETGLQPIAFRNLRRN